MNATLDRLALDIDVACDSNDVSALLKWLDVVAHFDRRPLSLHEIAALDFYAANAYAGLRQAANEDEKWAWVQPSLEQEIYLLSSALNRLDSAAVDSMTD